MWVKASHANTRVVDYKGKKNASVFVIVHGRGGSAASRETVATMLNNQGHTVYVADVPGFGKTDMDKTFTVETYADRLEEMIAGLGVADYTLLGHSNGGRMSIAFAARQPKGLEMLLLNNAAGIKRRPSLKRTTLHYLAKCLGWMKVIPGMRTVRRMIYKVIGGGDYVALDHESSWKKETFQHMLQSDLSEEMKAIAVKTYLIWGSEDTYTPLWQGKEMHALIPGSTLKVLDGQRHGIHLHDPALLVETIRGYVE